MEGLGEEKLEVVIVSGQFQFGKLSRTVEPDGGDGYTMV